MRQKPKFFHEQYLKQIQLKPSHNIEWVERTISNKGINSPTQRSDGTHSGFTMQIDRDKINEKVWVRTHRHHRSETEEIAIKEGSKRKKFLSIHEMKQQIQKTLMKDLLTLNSTEKGFPFVNKRNQSIIKFMSKTKKKIIKQQLKVGHFDTIQKPKQFFVKGNANCEKVCLVKLPKAIAKANKQKSYSHWKPKQLSNSFEKFWYESKMQTDSSIHHRPLELENYLKKKRNNNIENDRQQTIRYPSKKKPTQKMRQGLFSPWEPRIKQGSCQMEELFVSRKFNL